MNSSIILAITGSVAAFKAPLLVRFLQRNGFKVTCVLTKSAEKFVTSFALENVSDTKCYCEEDFWREKNIHIALCQSHDVLVLCPASANTLAKCAKGIADNLISTLCVAFEGPKVLVPAMHKEMIDQFSVEQNINVCKQLGFLVLGPTKGDLLSGDSGSGRMVEPASVAELCASFFCKPLDLRGCKMLVTAGGTVEQIDPVRSLSNSSSGKMGYMVACLATLYGAEVTLLSTKDVVDIGFYKLSIVRSSSDLMNEMMKECPNVNTLVMSAAVADFIPTYSKKKYRRLDHSFSLNLEPNRDLLKTVTSQFSFDKVIGFTLLDDLRDNQTPIKKCIDKQCDYMFANTAENIGQQTRRYDIYNRDGCVDSMKQHSITDVAYRLLELI